MEELIAIRPDLTAQPPPLAGRPAQGPTQESARAFLAGSFPRQIEQPVFLPRPRRDEVASSAF